MTSKANTQTIAAAYRGYETHPLLQDLSTELGITISSWETGVQPMISAFTHSDEGEPRGIFLEAFGEANTPLPLPGGHGQNFIALKSVYNRLFDQGKRLVYLGNVDNLGFLPDPRSIGYLIVDGACAGFDFSFKTKVDTKGGILLSQQGGGLTCADIGPGISMEEVEKAEAQDKKILFNCATGLFRLDYLTKNLDRIIQDLPTRISDQKKDAGKYSQAEQVTWEVLALLDRFLVFGVNKFDRFLAAKLLTDTFLTSGLIPDGNQDGLNPEINPQVHDLSQQLHHGLIGLLSGPYGLTLRNGAWQAPETADQPS
jgi:UDP-N-acetylglucosamine pyrophosphorylase